VLTASKFRYRSAGITDLRLEKRLTDDAPVNGRPGQEPATSTGRIGSDTGGAPICRWRRSGSRDCEI
jgi:hypothetical protein